MTKKRSASRELPAQQVREVKNALMHVDGWHSAMTGIGDLMSDKRLWAEFNADITNVVENAELWRGDDLASRIVETVPNEMMRQGFELSIEGEAGRAKDKIKDITSFWEDLGLNDFLWRALCYERAYGGAGILLGVNDLREMAEPLDIESVTRFDWMDVFEPLELHALTWQNDPSRRNFGYPETYMLHPITTGGSTVTGVTIHASRLLIFPGIRVSRRLLTAQPGWGDAVLTRCRAVLRDFQTAWDATGILIHDFAQAVLKIKGLAEIISLGKDKELQNRIKAIQLSRSVARAVVIDADAEEFERKQTPLNGLAELLDKFGTRLAAAADMPQTLLMGTSPGGLNATGESDVRGFYDRVKSKQIQKVKPHIERVVKIIMRVMGIEEPDSWSIKFHPLWQPTEKELAETRFIQAQTDEKNIVNSILAPEEVRESRFGGPEYSYETQIDPSLDLTPDPEPPPAPVVVGPDGKPLPPAPPQRALPPATGADVQRGDMLKQESDGWHVYSEDGEKHLGGPYDSKREAVNRLRQVEHFKEDGMTVDWTAYYRSMIAEPTRLDEEPRALTPAPPTAEEAAFIAWCDRCDADFEPNRDEKGQFASTGAASAAARSSAKEAVGHARELRAVAAQNPGSAHHEAAVAHAEKAAKSARSAARKAEASTTVQEAAGHAARAATHAASAKAKVAEVRGATPISRGGAMPGGKPREGTVPKSPTPKVAPSYTPPSREREGMQANANSRHAENMTSRAEEMGSRFSDPQIAAAHRQAGAAHREAAASHIALGHTQEAGQHQAAAIKHEQKAVRLETKPEHEKTYRKQVDDYEHSGDTEHEAERLAEHGAIVVGTHDGPDEDGGESGHVTYKLPKGLSKEQFNRVREAGNHVEGMRENMGERSSPHVHEAHAAYASAKQAAKAGRGEQAAAHAERAIQAASLRNSEIYTPGAHAAHREADAQTARANQLNTPEAHESAAASHQSAASAYRNAGDKELTQSHSKQASEHRSKASDLRSKEAGLAYHYSEPSKF